MLQFHWEYHIYALETNYNLHTSVSGECFFEIRTDGCSICSSFGWGHGNNINKHTQKLLSTTPMFNRNKFYKLLIINTRNKVWESFHDYSLLLHVPTCGGDDLLEFLFKFKGHNLSLLSSGLVMVSFCLHSHGELSNQSQFYDAITGLSCWWGMVNTETMSIFDSIKSIKFQGLWYLLLTLSFGWMQMCKIIDLFPHGVSKLTRAFAAASLYYNYSGTEKCFDLENEKDVHGLHGWDWQVLAGFSTFSLFNSDSEQTPPANYKLNYTYWSMKTGFDIYLRAWVPFHAVVQYMRPNL